MSLSILDKSLADLKAALPSYSLGELEVLKAAEIAGKTRKGAIALIDEALAAAEPVSSEVEVENVVPGLDITLHDGAHLLFGERATVPAELAALLIGRGQAK